MHTISQIIRDLLPENKNGKASASRGDVVSEPVVPAAAIARILKLFNPFDLLKYVFVVNKLPVVIVGGAVKTRSLPYVVFSCVCLKIDLK